MWSTGSLLLLLFFYRRACQENYNGINDYRQHLQEDHKLILPPLIKKEESLVTPEVVNINKAKINYCYECQRSHRSRLEYKKHLTSVNKIGVPSNARRHLDKTIKPDPNDPEFYCKYCKLKHNALGLYRTHLRLKYNMSFAPLKPKSNRDIEPDPGDPNFYCKSCDTNYLNCKHFAVHLHITHHVTIKSLKTKNTNIEPNPNDPNFYYRSCNYKYLNKECFVIQAIQTFTVNLAKLSLLVALAIELTYFVYMELN